VAAGWRLVLASVEGVEEEQPGRGVGRCFLIGPAEEAMWMENSFFEQEAAMSW